MNEANRATYSEASDHLDKAARLLHLTLRANDSLAAVNSTLTKERDDAWTRNTKLKLLDVENQQLAERCETLNEKRAEAEAERDSAQKLLLSAIESRDSWASRFRGLEADMRGMESMLNDERARVKAHMEQNAQNERIIKDYQTATRANALVVAAEARFESMKLERDKAQDELSSAKLAQHLEPDTMVYIREVGGMVRHAKIDLVSLYKTTPQEPLRVEYRVGDRRLLAQHVWLTAEEAFAAKD